MTTGIPTSPPGEMITLTAGGNNPPYALYENIFTGEVIIARQWQSRTNYYRLYEIHISMECCDGKGNKWSLAPDEFNFFYKIRPTAEVAETKPLPIVPKGC